MGTLDDYKNTQLAALLEKYNKDLKNLETEYTNTVKSINLFMISASMKRVRINKAFGKYNSDKFTLLREYNENYKKITSLTSIPGQVSTSTTTFKSKKALLIGINYKNTKNWICWQSRRL